MNKRQHDATVRVRWAVKRGTAEQQQAAAIEFCYAYHMQPYWRYRLQPRFVSTPYDGDKAMPLDACEYSITEWERVLRRAAQPSF